MLGVVTACGVDRLSTDVQEIFRKNSRSVVDRPSGSVEGTTKHFLLRVVVWCGMGELGGGPTPKRKKERDGTDIEKKARTAPTHEHDIHPIYIYTSDIYIYNI